jgi:hypothetical protein
VSWPIRGLSLDLRAQEVGRARAVKTGRFVRRGEPTSSLIIMCEQAAPLQAGHLGAACLKSRAGSNATR